MKKCLVALGFTFGLALTHLAMYNLDKNKVSTLIDDAMGEIKSLI